MTTNNSTQHAAALLRLALGIMFIAHGLLKVMVFGMEGTVGFFDSVGFPGWAAYPVTAFEVLGGIALVLGVFTRWVALASIPVLLGALFVHAGNGWVFSSPNGGWEYPAFLVVVAIAVALQGGGSFAVKRD